MTYKFKVEFLKTFRTGILNGVSRYETLPFVSIVSAEKWIQAIQKTKTLDYQISDARILSNN
jgi:hypothetical protein